ncbi:MAG: hypothetical protein ACOVOT_04545 [Rubrivivax sp.]|jgi:hypothetical protein|nr:hypothetical protein [Rubrivivax sp.]
MKLHPLVGAAAVALLLVGVGPSWAQTRVAAEPGDNQPTVLRAPSAKGWPLVISAPGHYTLNAPLVVPAGQSALRIVAPQVTINLNGHAIAGPGLCRLNTRFAIACQGNSDTGVAQGVQIDALAHDAVVRDGTISGFETGLSFRAAGRIERLRVSHNSLVGVELHGGAVLQVHELRAELNDTALFAGDGRFSIERAQLQFNGIAVRADRASLIADSLISDNGLGLDGAVAQRGSRISENRMDASPRRF